MQAVAAVEATMNPEVRKDYDKIVATGLQWGVKNGSAGLLASLTQSRDPVRDCAIGAINAVFKFISGVSRGTMPQVPGVYASKSLMYLALDFADRAGIVDVGVPEVEKAERLWANGIFTAFGITPKTLSRGAEEVKGILNDPGRLEQLNLATGYLKDPRAAQPLEMTMGQPAEQPARPMNRRERRAAARAGRT